MKRKRTSSFVHGTGDIRKDLSETQLASLGAVALAFNEAELMLDLLVTFALGLSNELAADVTSRINGIDGKIAIIKAAMKVLGASEEFQKLLAETLGKSGFEILKGYRDGVIHARTFDAPTRDSRNHPKTRRVL